MRLTSLWDAYTAQFWEVIRKPVDSTDLDPHRPVIEKPLAP
jgi:hypothetical protein